jgi:hypothetical protein
MRTRAVVLSFLVLLGTVAVAAVAPAAVAHRDAPRPAHLAPPRHCHGCWHPGRRVSWQWQLQDPPAATDLMPVQMYDIDGFDTPKHLVQVLHANDMKAVCYISAGSWENWRPDAGRFPPSVLGNSNGWPGEKWLDIRDLATLAPIMRDRIARCARKGFDAMEFDNVDGYTNNTGFPLTGDDQLRYNVFLANTAHARGMSAFLKNDIDQVKTLLPYFEGELNEQCFQYSECGKIVPFVKAGKPVFNVEYSLGISAFCPKANAKNFNSLKKRLALGRWRVPCRGV